ncbi:MAG: hypothetical protein KAT86_05475 [Candidatus Latescibacteria bacterium]|jgi:hypothetical protein|nr:hypothetical protein [Candidatus Latescibacterota bacterium]
MYENIRGALTGSLKAGYFFGFTTCGWNTYGQTVDGIASFFYIDSGNASGGLLTGGVSGSYSTDLHDWNASGSLDWVELSLPDSLTVPGSVEGITDYARDIYFVSGSGSGNFYDAGSNIGDFNIYKSDGIFDSIQEGQHWGFWQNYIGSTYSTIAGKTLVDCDDWFLEWEQKGWECSTHILNLRLYMSAKGTIPHYRNVEGDVAGGWVDIEHAVTGIAVGELHGGYDPYSDDIFAGSGGVWISTSILMDKLTTAPDDLAKLNIPNVAIGTATLKGSSPTGADRIVDVTMAGVTFLAHASGGTPKIWATESVTGSYTGTPSAGMTASLTQSVGTNASGLTADFNVRTWGSSKWDATVTNGAGTVGGKNITFKGGAAGSIDNPAAGQIKGTAAGWAK